MPQIAVSSVVERDIDFLLIEGIVASEPFLRWFLQKAGVFDLVELLAVEHSASTATGETDIELTVKTNQGTTIVLIENKIDANLQPRQAERYSEKAARYIAEGQCTSSSTVIVAPRAYFGNAGDSLGFQHAILYEDIFEWFTNAGDLPQKNEVKRSLLRRALDRGSAGWRLVPDETATEFWRRYWELTRTLAPELRMPRPSVKPAASTFIFFRPAALPKGASLVHKLPYGNVDIQLPGKASAIQALTRKYGSLLEPGMAIEAASKSAVVRISVPPIDIRAPFLDSEAAVREGIWAAKLLNLWSKRARL